MEIKCKIIRLCSLMFGYVRFIRKIIDTPLATSMTIPLEMLSLLSREEAGPPRPGQT
jgi:hypothetical protein